MKFVKTYEDATCKEFDIIVNNTKVAYYVEYVKNPETNEDLESPVFEMYYNEDFEDSYVSDSLEDCLSYADLV